MAILFGNRSIGDKNLDRFQGRSPQDLAYMVLVVTFRDSGIEIPSERLKLSCFCIAIQLVGFAMAPTNTNCTPYTTSQIHHNLNVPMKTKFGEKNKISPMKINQFSRKLNPSEPCSNPSIIPLNPGCFIGIPRSWLMIIPYILDSIIAQLLNRGEGDSPTNPAGPRLRFPYLPLPVVRFVVRSPQSVSSLRKRASRLVTSGRINGDTGISVRPNK